MRVYKYSVSVYCGVTDFLQVKFQCQTRLYIPNKAVIGFRNLVMGVDFFSDRPEDIAEGEDIINCKKDGTVYIGFMELSDELVLKVMDLGRQMDSSRKALQTTVKSLSDLITQII